MREAGALRESGALSEGRARFGVVGRGWRAEFFVRLARLLPERLEVMGVVTRTSSAARIVRETWGVDTFPSTEAMLAREPEFVVVAVPWATNPGIVEAVAGAGVPVLCETPPAPDLDGLRRLWANVGAGGLVQVAEQYHLYPGHVARRALLASGRLGATSSVHVSSTHLYHAVSLIRTYLDVGFEDATVRSSVFHGPLVDPLAKAGWTGDDTERTAATTLATIEFSSGRMGFYDFTDNQWHNPLRSRRVLIRASRGEIANDDVVRVVDARTVIESPIVRRQTGWDLNLEGFGLDHLSNEGHVLYRSPFPDQSFSDEDIAIAALLLKTAAWARGDGPAPYPLADGSQDHALALAIQASAQSGEAVGVSREPWASP